MLLFVYSESVNRLHIEALLNPVTSSILRRLQVLVSEKHIESYLVGGLLRDIVMGRDTADIDIAVAADALALGQEMAEMLCAHYVLLDTQNGVVRLLPRKDSPESWQIDIATLQGDLEHDLGRRDFTIDAMAIDLAALKLDDSGRIEARIIDPFDGMGDTYKKLIRAVSPRAFQQDAVRMLRSVRLGAELGFDIEARTEVLIEREHNLIKNIAGERIREELLRLFALSGTYETVVYMDRLGLLTAIIPELTATREVDQPREHTWNVFHHSARSISALDFILRRGGWEFTQPDVLDSIPWNDAIRSYFETQMSPLSTYRVLTKLAALLHDIAKPQTRVVNEYGKVRFYGHPQEGAPLAAAILERLRFSTREIKFVETIVRYHLRPVQMTEDGAPPTPRAVYRYFRDLKEAAVATLYFSLADHLATRGPALEKDNWECHVSVVAELIAEHEKPPPPATLRPLLDGHDLQRELGLKPGKNLGALLEELKEAQAAGEITTRREALDYVKKLLAGGKNNPSSD